MESLTPPAAGACDVDALGEGSGDAEDEGDDVGEGEDEDEGEVD